MLALLLLGPLDYQKEIVVHKIVAFFTKRNRFHFNVWSTWQYVGVMSTIIYVIYITSKDDDSNIN